MASVVGKTTVGVALTILPGTGDGALDEMQRILLQADPDHDWTYGTGDYQVTKWYENLDVGLTVSGSSSTSVDLNTLTGLAGETVNFSGVKLIWVYNPSTTVGDTFTIEGNFFTVNIGAQFGIMPGSCLFVPSPITQFAVVNAVSDTLTFTNNAATSKVVKYFLAGV